MSVKALPQRVHLVRLPSSSRRTVKTVPHCGQETSTFMVGTPEMAGVHNYITGFIATKRHEKSQKAVARLQAGVHRD